jgi:hypothetical protein
VNTIMIEKRGYESALSACPAPAAAAFAAAAPASARLRAGSVGFRLTSGAVQQFQGTGLPVAGRFVDAPTMLVQPHPGDKARRPPA